MKSQLEAVSKQLLRVQEEKDAIRADHRKLTSELQVTLC
jgi:uncharacterized protein (DUF3084 family)